MSEWRAVVVTEVRRTYYVYADDEDEARDVAGDEAAADFGYEDVVDIDVESVEAVRPVAK